MTPDPRIEAAAKAICEERSLGQPSHDGAPSPEPPCRFCEVLARLALAEADEAVSSVWKALRDLVGAVEEYWPADTIDCDYAAGGIFGPALTAARGLLGRND